MAKQKYQSQISKQVEQFAVDPKISSISFAENVQTEAAADPEVEKSDLETPENNKPSPKKMGRPKKNGEKVRVSLIVPEVLYLKVQEEADRVGGSNITRTINKILGAHYGIEIQ